MGTAAKLPERGPFWIIDPDSPKLAAFTIMVGSLSMPSVFMNLFFIAFGFLDKDYDTLWIVAQTIEIVFLIEIIVHFFTSY